jgi:UDP-glucose 4-epimerase
MRALITGGAGFVGSHLADWLLGHGHEVLVLDDLSTGSIDNIAHLKADPRFHYSIDSVLNEPVLAELVDGADVVFHLAAAVGVKLIVEQPVRTIETNVHGTEVVLTHANKKKKLVLIASTSEVYGKNAAVPFSEEADLVLGPTTKHRWAYACSKAIDEFLALAYWKEKKLPVIVVRLFNTVGPRQTGQYGMVIPNFVQQALAGQPITVFGDGTQTRSFTYVGDVVDALARLAQEPAAIGRAGAGRDWARVQCRQQLRGFDPRAGRARQDADRQRLRDRDRSVRRGLRGRVRGHAPARAGHLADSRPDRIRTASPARRDPRAGHRLLQNAVGTAGRYR